MRFFTTVTALALLVLVDPTEAKLRQLRANRVADLTEDAEATSQTSRSGVGGGATNRVDGGDGDSIYETSTNVNPDSGDGLEDYFSNYEGLYDPDEEVTEAKKNKNKNKVSA